MAILSIDKAFGAIFGSKEKTTTFVMGFSWSR